MVSDAGMGPLGVAVIDRMWSADLPRGFGILKVDSRKLLRGNEAGSE